METEGNKGNKSNVNTNTNTTKLNVGYNKTKKSKPNIDLVSQTKESIDSYNFKNGELFIRMNYLALVSKFFYNYKNANTTPINGDANTDANAYANSDTNVNTNTNISNIYLTQLRKIKQRHNLKISREFKRKTCSKCSGFLFFNNKNNLGENKNIHHTQKPNFSVCEVEGKQCVLIECGSCGYITKIIIQ